MGKSKTYEERKAEGQLPLMIWLSPPAARALLELATGGVSKTAAIESALMLKVAAVRTGSRRPAPSQPPPMVLEHEPAIDALPLAKSRCPVCNGPMRVTPASGNICQLHGGYGYDVEELSEVLPPAPASRRRTAERVDLLGAPITLAEKIRQRGPDRTAILVATGEELHPDLDSPRRRR